MKFSIVTCTYNSAAYLQRNIDSVKQQTFTDYEHIFIDGFSTDRTIEIIKKYQTDFPHQVKLVQSQPRGISQAMNRGIVEAKGEYINHLHSDDYYSNQDVLNTVAASLIKQNYPDWIYGQARFVDETTGQNRVIPHRRVYHAVRYWLLLLTDYIPHQAVFLKKTVFEKFGLFDETLKNRMDYDLWLRLAREKISEHYIDQVLCIFSLRKDSQSVAFKVNREHEIIYKRLFGNTLMSRVLISIADFNQRRSLF